MYNPVSIYLIRHGQSISNINPDIIGQAPDVQLSDLGKEQSELLGNNFVKNLQHVDAVYSSPYDRALSTCSIAIKDVYDMNHVYIDDSIKEYNPGKSIGLRRSEHKEIVDKIRIHGMNFSFNGSETGNQVKRRTSAFIDNLISKYNNKDNILVFSHGLAIKSMLQHIMGFNEKFYFTLRIDNTSVSKVMFSEDNGWEVGYINNTSHLGVSSC